MRLDLGRNLKADRGSATGSAHLHPLRRSLMSTQKHFAVDVRHLMVACLVAHSSASRLARQRMVFSVGPERVSHSDVVAHPPAKSSAPRIENHDQGPTVATGLEVSKFDACAIGAFGGQATRVKCDTVGIEYGLVVPNHVVE